MKSVRKQLNYVPKFAALKETQYHNFMMIYLSDQVLSTGDGAVVNHACCLDVAVVDLNA
jgi:hypothetical protein